MENTQKKIIVRLAPSEKANTYEEGFIKKGQNGMDFIVKMDKKGVRRWMKMEPEKEPEPVKVPEPVKEPEPEKETKPKRGRKSTKQAEKEPEPEPETEKEPEKEKETKPKRGRKSTKPKMTADAGCQTSSDSE
jgi:hypothetical protein